MLHLCHTAYLSPETASLHSGSLGHHEPSPIFMHNLSSMIAEYRSDPTSRILIDERLCISWHFLICIWVKSISNLRNAESLYLGTHISCVVSLLSLILLFSSLVNYQGSYCIFINKKNAAQERMNRVQRYNLRTSLAISSWRGTPWS
jgi:hypothetical protein